MEDLAADFIIENNEPLELEAEISEPEHFDCSFELYAAGTTWGSISGTLSNQTDLQAALDLKADKSEVESVTGALADSITALDSVVSANYTTLSDSITALDSIVSTKASTSYVDSITGGLSDSISGIDSIISNYGDIVNYNVADFADSAQGALADTAVQPTDLASVAFSGEYSDLINTPTIPTVNDGQLTIQVNGSDLATFSANQGTDTIANISIPNAAEWGNIIGTLSDQTDLQNALDLKVTNNATGTKALAVGDTSQSTAEGGVAVGYGARANSTYATAVGEDTRANNTNTTVIGRAAKATEARAIAIGSGAEANAQDAIAIKGINNTANTFQVYTYNMLDMSTGLIPDARISSAIARTSDMQTADNGLQSQIDAIVASSDVFDIVGTYAELQAYDISTVPVNDIIKVLVDSTHNDAATYYRCTESGGVKSWTYIGAEGAYYTKSESDNRFVPLTREINGIALSSNITLTASDVGALPNTTIIPTVNNSSITFQVNSTDIDTITLNQSSNDTINISVPTDTNDLTNGAGYITGINSTDVINALGYTPYSDANPDGFITSSALSGYATETWVGNQGYLTSADLTNYVTTNTAQTISAKKTFTGEKAILFKQTSNSDKLGFTLYNSSNTELGAFEYRPNTISGKALLNVNCPYAGDYVGFRYWGTAVNVVAPKVATAGTYYIPTHITDGNTTVTASNTGSVNISSLLPTVPTTDQTYDGTSANPQSGVAIEGELANYVKNTHTGSGLTSYIDYVSDEPIMQYEDSSYIYSVSAAHDTACLYAKNKGNNNRFVAGVTPTNFVLSSNGGNAFISIVNSELVVNGDTIATVSDIPTDFTGADSVTAGASGLVPAPSAGDDDKILTGGGSWESVTTALGYTPVNKSGDTMTGGLVSNVSASSLPYIVKFNDVDFDIPPSGNWYSGIEIQDAAGRRMGRFEYSYNADGSHYIGIADKKNSSEGVYSLMRTGFLSNGSAYCLFPNTTCVDGQWIDAGQGLISTAPTMSASTDLKYRFTLPNDGHKYEVLVRGRVTTGSTSGNYVFLSIIGNQDGTARYVCGARTRANSGVEAIGTALITASYVASGSYNLTVGRSTNYNGTLNILDIVAYRRIGTNT